ncbi:MAG: FixH family protein [Myxococcales bacterium]|nr:FixH family protein [Myxococcales bacterium]
MKALATALFGLLLAACGGNDSAATVPDSAAFDRCDGVDVSVFAPGLSFATTDGLFTVTFRSASPAPPARGDNAWTVALSDASGAALGGATLTITPTMPTHGHGTSPPRFSAVAGSEDGVYDIPPMDLFMPGPWRNLFTISAGDERDTGEVWFCIPR